MNENRDKLCAEIGAEESYSDGLAVFGGLVAVVFPSETEIDKTVWKKSNASYNAFTPRMSGKGAKMYDRFKSIGSILRYDFDEIMNYTQIFAHIGFSWNNTLYFGVVIDPKFTNNIPIDCVEITGGEYESLFPEVLQKA